MRHLVGLLAAAGLTFGLTLAPALANSPPPASIAPSAAASALPSAEPTPSWLATSAPIEEPLPLGKPGEMPILPYLLQLLVVTAVVAALGFFSLRYVRDKVPGLAMGPGMGKQIRVVEKLVIDAKRMVFMVNVGDRYWLMAATESQVTPIAELSKDDLGGQFARLLEQEKQRGESP